MEQKNIFTKILAVIGLMLVWFPLLSPIVFSVVVFSKDRIPRFDYLMPAELFPAALIGGGLLVWASTRARSHRALIGWGMGIAVGFLVAGQSLALATGMASGETEPSRGLLTLVLGSVGLYVLGLVAIGVGGVFLAKDVFGQSTTRKADSNTQVKPG